ncbi:hypothetical protein [Malacoplasma muris]|uniref:hypothetical protein n=1 Tax=Malacoplasma muris TaxID=2119 RepID=UPI00398F6B71
MNVFIRNHIYVIKMLNKELRMNFEKYKQNKAYINLFERIKADFYNNGCNQENIRLYKSGNVWIF